MGQYTDEFLFSDIIDLDDNMIIDGMKTEAVTDRKVPIHPEIKPDI